MVIASSRRKFGFGGYVAHAVNSRLISGVEEHSKLLGVLDMAEEDTSHALTSQAVLPRVRLVSCGGTGALTWHYRNT